VSLEHVAQDLSVADERRQLFASVGSRFQRVLIMTEGLLCYLAPDDAMGLAKDTARSPHASGGSPT
jgi:non-ribosomal peptide synthetase component E (peptide arylation enzyme)